MEQKCIFSTKKQPNGCQILISSVACDPSKCMWRHTEETYFQSLEKAMHNYQKKTGRTDYIDKMMDVLGMSWKERFVNWLLQKKNAEQQIEN